MKYAATDFIHIPITHRMVASVVESAEDMFGIILKDQDAVAQAISVWGSDWDADPWDGDIGVLESDPDAFYEFLVPLRDRESALGGAKLNVIEGEVAHVYIGDARYERWPITDYRIIDQDYSTIVCEVEGDLETLRESGDDHTDAKNLLRELRRRGIVYAFIHP